MVKDDKGKSGIEIEFNKISQRLYQRRKDINEARIYG